MQNSFLNIGNFVPRRVDGFEKVLKIRPQRLIENVNLTRKFPFFHDFGHFCAQKRLKLKRVLNISLNIGNFGPRRVDGFEKVLKIRPQ